LDRSGCGNPSSGVRWVTETESGWSLVGVGGWRHGSRQPAAMGSWAGPGLLQGRGPLFVFFFRFSRLLAGIS
jgi:hypothetical protein